jgi:hypothetical protein
MYYLFNNGYICISFKFVFLYFFTIIRLYYLYFYISEITDFHLIVNEQELDTSISGKYI